jgi:subtilisin-like proprotein convertase family protein
MNTAKFWGIFAVAAAGAWQLAVADSFSFTNNLAIPDGQAAGVSDVETVASGVSQIGSVQVSLNISGDFNGDLYCYLQHSNALSVLLNRPGRAVGNNFGYADSGFNIILSDASTNGSIHTYEGLLTPTPGQPVTGVWQPDGRTTSPATVLATDPSTAGLSVFDNLNASGDWTLFIADLSTGGTSELNSWQLNFNAVPEPSVAALGVLGAGLLAASKLRKPKNIRK